MYTPGSWKSVKSLFDFLLGFLLKFSLFIVTVASYTTDGLNLNLVPAFGGKHVHATMEFPIIMLLLVSEMRTNFVIDPVSSSHMCNHSTSIL